jgi:hypothetical protein
MKFSTKIITPLRPAPRACDGDDQPCHALRHADSHFRASCCSTSTCPCEVSDLSCTGEGLEFVAAYAVFWANDPESSKLLSRIGHALLLGSP